MTDTNRQDVALATAMTLGRQADELITELEAHRLELKRVVRMVAGVRDRCCGHGCMHDEARKVLEP